MRSEKIRSQLDRKSKTCFFSFFNAYVSEFEREKTLMSQFKIRLKSLQNSGILQTRMNQRGNPMKMNFDNFQIQKSISQKVRAQKVDEKIGVICLVSFLSS